LRLSQNNINAEEAKAIKQNEAWMNIKIDI